MKSSLLATSLLLLGLVSAHAADLASPPPVAVAQPHVLLLQDGAARPEDGYAWVRPDDMKSAEVVWRPGTQHRVHPHVVAAAVEGEWIPAPGYRFLNDTRGDFTVVWTAGLPHPRFAHVRSSAPEGRWLPEAGYRFANQSPGDFTVVRSGPSEQQMNQACASVVMGLLANAIAQGEPEDFGDALIIAAARAARDQLILNALTNLFSEAPAPQLRSAANLITLAADGRLTAANWLARQTIDGLGERLRAASPEAAQTFEVAQFIGSVVNAYQSRR